ncbi:MAG: response regulator transcription factor [Comamonadaceae bacterium]|nr:MAG: response regulator transcription factor [Comamonadaceae bacterium]
MHSVFVLDDHDIVRFGLETLIEASGLLRVVGSSATLSEGLGRIAVLQPDLVISDMSMDDSKGLDTVKAVVQAQKPRPVLIVSMHDELIYAEQVLALGARGYVMKENAHAMVMPAAQALLRGERWVSNVVNSRILSRMMKHARPGENAATAASQLTVRELQVLEKLGLGKTTKEIAFELDLSSRTVDIHRAHIKKKLHLKSGSELIAFAISRL